MRDHAVRASAAAALALAVLLAGCGGGDGTPAARPSSTGRLAIVEPSNGERVEGPTVPIEISLEGAEIDPETSTNLVPDRGHIHVTLDGTLTGMNYDLESEIPDVEPGQHVLRVEFVALDHAPFQPRVFAEAVFEVVP